MFTMIKKVFFVILLLLITKSFATEYYVSINGSDSNDGRSENTAWKTITYAAKKAKAGDIVWIKSGDYGNENVIIKNSGRIGLPISFIGYKNTPGDITSMYYTYAKNKPLDPKEMPLLDGKDRSKFMRGIDLTSRSYIIIKNIQITNYSILVKAGGKTHNITFDNIIGKSAGNYDAVTTNQGSGYAFLFDDDDAYNNTFTNCIAINATSVNFRIYGSDNIMDNCQSYCDEGTRNDNTGIQASTDYFIVIRGNNNVVRNCYVERVGNLVHTGHGISLKSVGVQTENNLVENCTIVNVKGAIEARHRQVKNNTFRNITINGWPTPSVNGGIVIHDGANYNTFEKIKIDGTGEAFRWYETSEDGGVQENGHHNIFKNIIVNNVGTLVYSGELSVNARRIISNNTFENCTFVNIQNVYNGLMSFDNTNSLKNCIFYKVSNYKHKHSKSTFSWTESYNSYYDTNFQLPSGDHNMIADPQFEDYSKGNFRLKPTSKLIDAGTEIKNVVTDFDDNPRPKGNGYDIGAFEYQNDNLGANMSTGPDVSICSGSSTILDATGGDTYLWSTGETTQSITVTPEQTTTYSVEITKDTITVKDSVEVTVIESPEANAGNDLTTCQGSEVVLTATGGDTFLWSTGETTASIIVNPNETTTYNVKTSNLGCDIISEDNVVVTVLPLPNLNAGNDVDICRGSEIILTATGADNFQWSTGETTASITVSPDETTIYTVTSDNGNCSITDEVIVNVSNDIPQVTASNDVEICQGESVTLSAEGIGTFTWSNDKIGNTITVSPSQTTTYTVKATNPCGIDAEDTVTVTVSNLPKVNAGSDVTITNGEGTILTATGDGNFVWSTGQTGASITVNPQITTTYTVIATSDTGCTNEDSVKVTVQTDSSDTGNSNQGNNANDDNSDNQVTIVDAGPDVQICKDASIVLTATGGQYYVWSTGETTQSITVSPDQTTTYSVLISDGNNVDSDYVTVTVDEDCSELSNRYIEQEMKIYPNPATNILNIELKGFNDNLTITLYNLNGNIIYSEGVNNLSLEKPFKRQINLSKFGRGIYFIRLSTNTNVNTKKLLFI